MISACLLAACAPTIHVDAPAMPALDAPRAAVQRHALNTEKEKIAPLDPPPQLPDVDRSLSSCPPGSGFVACFTPEQEAIRQRRFKILHDDRDYCRDAYDRARERASE